MSQPTKIVYLAPRPEGVSVEDFRPRWRAFGATAMSLPLWENMSGYDQCDPVAAPEQLRGLPLAADPGGVGMIWFRSTDHMARLASFPDLQIMRDAEVELFGRLNEGELVTSEHLVVPGRAGVPAVELIAFLQRDAALEPGALREPLRGATAAFRAGPAAPHVTRYVQDHVAQPGDGPDAVVELGFADLDGLVAALAPPVALDAALGLPPGLVDIERSIVAIVRRTILFPAA
jgi:hypothetical protein